MSITAQAKRDGYGACGILVPNTYFGEAAHRKSAGDLDVWRKQGAFIRKAGEARPAAKRLPRVLWRGKCLNNEYQWGSTALAYAFEIGQVQTMKNCPVACRLCRDSKNCRDSTTWRRGHPPRQPESCEWVSKKVKHRCGGVHLPPGSCAPRIEYGNRQRLLAASLTAARPDRFDVKCSALDPPRNFSCLEPAAARELAAARDAVAAKRAAVEDDAWLTRKDYTKYKYVLNLPGQTTGSYSRNLNHLWSTGAAVVLWDGPWVEWYYPALATGKTHLAVNRSTAEAAVDRVEADGTEFQRLVKEAKRVDQEHVCASCIANYWRRALEAIRARAGYADVLDDPRTLLKLFERADKCAEVVLAQATYLAGESDGGVKGSFTNVEAGPNVCEELRRMIKGS